MTISDIIFYLSHLYFYKFIDIFFMSVVVVLIQLAIYFIGCKILNKIGGRNDKNK